MRERGAPTSCEGGSCFSSNCEMGHAEGVATLNYMHANPVVRELVSHPEDWVWSSWSNYEKGTGVIEVDFV